MKAFWKNVHSLINKINKKYPNSFCSVTHTVFMIHDGNIFEWYEVSITDFDPISGGIFKTHIETQNEVITTLKSVI